MIGITGRRKLGEIARALRGIAHRVPATVGGASRSTHSKSMACRHLTLSPWWALHLHSQRNGATGRPR